MVIYKSSAREQFSSRFIFEKKIGIDEDELGAGVRDNAAAMEVQVPPIGRRRDATTRTARAQCPVSRLSNRTAFPPFPVALKLIGTQRVTSSYILFIFFSFPVGWVFPPRVLITRQPQVSLANELASQLEY